MRHTAAAILYCALLATFEQEVGNSKQELVSQVEVWACGNRYDLTTTIKVVEQVVVGATGEKVGAPRNTFLPLPKVEPPPQEPPASETPGQ